MAVAVSLLAVACGSSKDQASSTTTAPVGSASGNTIRVPADKPTIQAAVDAAEKGDLILISPGVYKEA